ncbi:YggS family pyridoxal phosphate-dependent enzyme [Pyrinomonas sp.]|uniref:YggS family pyridoxal phosphate-dependent enzyme n=1 Tax=Pyrinomonas sp. TaxID=2080306 RepID=UPI0033273A11
MEACVAVEQLRARVEAIRTRIARACERVGRDPSEVLLIAVGKTFPVEALRRAIAAGVEHLGENRVQEAETKIREIGHEGVKWHLIGHLQSNKARRAVRLFDYIHSLDSAELVERLERLCREEGRRELPVLVQLNLAGEETKSGASEAELSRIIQALSRCERVRPVGLMTLPPFFADAQQARPYFRRLRQLRDRLRADGLFGDGRGELSMGMSHDFEVAIEEGATMVRVGTAIFGARLSE